MRFAYNPQEPILLVEPYEQSDDYFHSILCLACDGLKLVKTRSKNGETMHLL